LLRNLIVFDLVIHKFDARDLVFTRNTYLETLIPIDNQTASRDKFYSSNFLGVLTMDYLLEVVVYCLESPHQTYKTPSRRFCSFTNRFFVAQYPTCTSYSTSMDFIFFFLTIGTSLSHEGFNKPCLLSFSKWSKAIESERFVQKTHGTTKQQLIMCAQKPTN